MKSNKKTLIFLLGIFIIPLVSWTLLKSHKKAFSVWYGASENPSLIYSSKFAPVYNPLDQAFVVTPELLESKNNEDKIIKKYPSDLKYWKSISLWVDEKDLNDSDRGILANPGKRGRLWERASYFYFYEKGKLQQHGFAGLRLHGGHTRFTPGQKSFRLIFRKEYGVDSFETDRKIFGLPEKAKINRLVIHSDHKKPFTAQLAYEVTRHLGAEASYAHPVLLYINGEFLGFYYLALQQNRVQWAQKIGHQDFDFFNVKSSNKNKDYLHYQKLFQYVRFHPEPLLLIEIEKKINIKEFIAHVISLAYCGTMDWEQGIIYRDHLKDQKWKWVAWDMDLSFNRHRENQPQINFPWETESLGVILDHYRRNLRSLLLRRLLNESPEFKEMFRSAILEAINEKISIPMQEKILANLSVFAEEVQADELNNAISEFKEFMQNRNAVLLNDMYIYLNKIN